MERRRDVCFCIETTCNFKCPHCWHDSFRSRMEPISFSEYKRILLEDVKIQKYDRVVLSGAEATLNKDIIKFIRFAKEIEHIKNIRIQTNGSKLSDLNYCKSLLEAGVDEFYVSIYGHTTELQDKHTLVENSFIKTVKGLNNLSLLKANIIIGTIMTELNYKHLPEILLKASSFNPSGIFIWNYVCMDEEKRGYLIASNIKVRPYLLKALDGIKDLNLNTYIMFYPECLLGDFKELLDNAVHEDLIIDPLFDYTLEEVEIYTCPYKKICPSTKCYGIAEFRQRKYGVEGYKPFFKEYLNHSIVAYREKQKRKALS